MKFILQFYFIIFLSVQVFSQGIPDNYTTKRIALYEKASHRTSLKKSKSNTGNNYDVKYSRFAWYIDPAVYYIKGSVTTYFKANQNNVTQISFELSSILKVDSVKHKNTKLKFSQTSNDELIISTETKLMNNQLDSVQIYYGGSPVNDIGFGSFIQAYHLNYTGGKIVETPVIWTLSEPYGAKDWWPCKSVLNDKIDSIDVIVTTPKKYRVASNGLLVSEVLNGKNKTFHWKHRYAIAPYLVAIAVTNYTVNSDYFELPDGKKLEILNYIYPEDSAYTKPYTSATPKYMGLFSKLFCPYPFIKEKYGHAEFNWPGGMEHQTMTFIGYFNYEIINHELAHQWFGDMITTGDWHDIWLNEGFATYLTGLCYEYLEPDHSNWNEWKKIKRNSITSLPYGSVYVKDTANVDSLFSARLSYDKGAMFLHTIRWVIGDSAFYHAVRNYVNNSKFAYGYAKNNDLKYEFEAESQKDLTYLFDDWYYGEGYPTYNIQTTGYSDNNVLVKIDQSTSNKSVSFFELPVPIKFIGKDKDTVVVFNNTFSGQTFNTYLSFRPESVVFDPDQWLIAESHISLKTLVDNNDFAKQLIVSPNPAKDNCFINTLDLKVNKIELSDISGKMLLKQNVSTNNSKNQLTVNLKPFEAGSYLLKVSTDKGIITKKIVKIN